MDVRSALSGSGYRPWGEDTAHANHRAPSGVKFGHSDGDKYSGPSVDFVVSLSTRYGLKPKPGTPHGEIIDFVSELAKQYGALQSNTLNQFLLQRGFKDMNELIHLFGVGNEVGNPQAIVQGIVEEELGLQIEDPGRGISSFLANIIYIQHCMGFDHHDLPGITEQGQDMLARQMAAMSEDKGSPQRVSLSSLSQLTGMSVADIGKFYHDKTGLRIRNGWIAEPLTNAVLIPALSGLDAYDPDGMTEEFRRIFNKSVDTASKNGLRQKLIPLAEVADRLEMKEEAVVALVKRTYGAGPVKGISPALLAPLEAPVIRKHAREIQELSEQMERLRLRREEDIETARQERKRQTDLATKEENLLRIKEQLEIQDIAISNIHGKIVEINEYGNRENAYLKGPEEMRVKARWSPAGLGKKNKRNDGLAQELREIARKIEELKTSLANDRKPPFDESMDSRWTEVETLANGLNKKIRDSLALCLKNTKLIQELRDTLSAVKVEAGRLAELARVEAQLQHDHARRETLNRRAQKRGDGRAAQAAGRQSVPPAVAYEQPAADDPFMALIAPLHQVDTVPVVQHDKKSHRGRKIFFLATILTLGGALLSSTGLPANVLNTILGQDSRSVDPGDSQSLNTEEEAGKSVQQAKDMLLPSVNEFYKSRLPGFPVTTPQIQQAWDSAEPHLNFASMLAFEYTLHGADPYSEIAVDYEVENMTAEDRKLTADGNYDPLFQKARERFAKNLMEAHGNDVVALGKFFDQGAAINHNDEDLSASRQAFIDYYSAHKKEISDYLLAQMKYMEAPATLQPFLASMALQSRITDEEVKVAAPSGNAGKFLTFDLNSSLPDLIDGATFKNEALTDSSHLQNPAFLTAFMSAYLMLYEGDQPSAPNFRGVVHELQGILNTLEGEQRTLLKALEVYEQQHADQLAGSGEFPVLTQTILTRLNSELLSTVDLNAPLNINP